ncbi:hypothetical protein [Wenjunlia tyrosinilytica]|uniref:hypothetical protein n=1 Tax=Wenjunlia tyrosinilytica TaxID=1544741 RepID=UPI00166E8A07|nr:hypothetical protein [Wenjunlia tyrosinilytica]
MLHRTVDEVRHHAVHEPARKRPVREAAKRTLKPVVENADKGPRQVTGLVHEVTGVSVPLPSHGGSGDGGTRPTPHHPRPEHPGHAEQSAPAGDEAHAVPAPIHQVGTADQAPIHHTVEQGTRDSARAQAPADTRFAPASGHASQSAVPSAGDLPAALPALPALPSAGALNL